MLELEEYSNSNCIVHLTLIGNITFRALYISCPYDIDIFYEAIVWMFFQSFALAILHVKVGLFPTGSTI